MANTNEGVKPFTGNNELSLNMASIREAVQFWLNETKFRDGAAVTVTSVEQDHTNATPTFTVCTCENDSD